MTDSKVKIALIGAGGWGQQHARIFADRQDVDFCAIVGRTEGRTRTRAERYGAAYYLDIAEMLTAEKPDLVSMCLPNKGHFDATLQVIEAGFPLFVEKPLVFDLAQADTLLAEAAKRGLFFGINFNHRYAVPVQMAHQAIADGRLGEIAFITWRFGGEGGSCPEHENLIETQCHGFDMLEYLAGPIDSVMAQMTGPGDKVNSTMVIALHFASGAVGSLVGTYDGAYACSDTHLLEVNGTAGRAVVHDTVRQYSFHPADSETGEVWQAGYFNDTDREFLKTFDKHFELVLKAFRAGESPPVPAQAGRRALQLAHASIESFETGKRVEV